jgi:hypothetical protein
VPLNPHDLSKSATTAPAILQTLLLLSPANSIPGLPAIKLPSNGSNVVVTYNIHFIYLFMSCPLFLATLALPSKKMTVQHGVCHTVALPFTLKSILRQRRIIKTQIFHYAKIIIFKKSSKRNQNLSRHYNSIINLKFQHKPKYHLSKILK